MINCYHHCFLSSACADITSKWFLAHNKYGDVAETLTTDYLFMTGKTAFTAFDGQEEKGWKVSVRHVSCWSSVENYSSFHLLTFIDSLQSLFTINKLARKSEYQLNLLPLNCK